MSSAPSQNDPTPPRSGASRLRWIVLGGAAIVAFLYFVPIPFIAYTSDAYVRSDFVEVAPQVSGVVNHVDVANDQKVAVGDLLATLDPEPFALGVDLDQKRLDGAAAAAKVSDEEARVLASALETAKAAVTLAQQDYDRMGLRRRRLRRLDRAAFRRPLCLLPRQGAQRRGFLYGASGGGRGHHVDGAGACCLHGTSCRRSIGWSG